jgi:hypothetical protein
MHVIGYGIDVSLHDAVSDQLRFPRQAIPPCARFSVTSLQVPLLKFFVFFAGARRRS